MRAMPVVCTDAEINDRVRQICAKFDDFVEPVFFSDGNKAIEYVRYELPEINLVNFSDSRIDALDFIQRVKSDPWLHYGGIIGVHRRQDRERAAEAAQATNLVALLPRSRFVNGFYRVLRILSDNRQILFQRDLQTYLIRNLGGTFVMDNDPFDIETYSNIVTNYLFNSNYIDRDGQERLHVALHEMLLNAVEHGNCGITYEDKSAWLEQNPGIMDLIRERNRDPEIRAKKVRFSYRITPEESSFTIEDEGKGFDWRARIAKQKSEENLGLHGRGMQMTEHYVEDLTYNEKGNRVSFRIQHNRASSSAIPAILHEQTERKVSEGEVVFSAGEASDSLYYIVSGDYGVYSGGSQLTVLTPDDIFLGEMSFLLGNRRSATVRAESDGALIEISKNDFLNLIRNAPHYGVFLARLLAQRLSRLNDKVAHAKVRAIA